MKYLFPVILVLILGAYSCKHHSSDNVIPGSSNLLGTRNYTHIYSYIYMTTDSTVSSTTFDTVTISQVSDSVIKFGSYQPLKYSRTDSTSGCIYYLSTAGPGGLNYYYNNDSIYCSESQGGIHAIEDVYYSVHQ